MKKITTILYMMCGCAVMLSSCAQQDAPEITPDAPSDRKIVFHTSIPGIERRAAEITTGLDALRLTVYNADDERLVENGKLTEYTDNLKLEKPVNSDMFTSDLCLWPEPGREDEKLHFFAYYPELPSTASLVNKTAVSGDNVAVGYGITGYSIAPEIADQIDFVTAYATGTMDNDLFAGINLNFRHQLSRVEVLVKGQHKSCDIEVAGVSFGCAVMEGDLDFQTANDADGKWNPTSRGNATYIYRPGDKIVAVGSDPVSIMGSKIDDSNENCAMLIPATLTPWAYDTDATNTAKGLYLNVLLRVLDKTPGGNNKQQYPYFDHSQGLNALSIPVVLIPVDTDGMTVTGAPIQVYKDKDGNYFTNPEKMESYTVPAGTTVKEFGWAAVPVSAEWTSGKIHTYTLDYTYGVGVHGPETPGDVTPKAGDPIISDKVGVSLGFKDWTNGVTSTVPVPGN